MQELTLPAIKGYELRECLGEGGFGAVYKAYQPAVGREVAIKIILPGLANQPDFIRRFETEAQVIARLEHPCIVPLYDYWRDPDGAYLVMRWLRGGSLQTLLKQGALDIETATQMIDQIARALIVAHRSNIIHRDIKPGNILLDEDGNAYLADFGIAKDLQQSEGGGTQMDAIVGSLDYISPEQARSEPVTPRTDIYSLGVVLYEMLAGEHPFPNLTSIERLYKHINDPPPEITGLDEGIRDAVNAVIQKATAKNPARRYEDIMQFALAFKEAAGLNRAPTGSTIVELLTRREQEVLSLLVAGASNKEIAQKLVITIPTVKWYIIELFRKLRVRSRVQAIVRARELNLIVNAAGTTAEAAVMTDNLPEPDNPYKGLRAFQAADEHDFFGREEFVQKLLKRLTPAESLTKSSETPRFLAIVGPSGSGKSSIVKAGLIPALLRGGLPGSDRWFVVEMLPGAHPYDELEIALLKIAPRQSQLRDQLTRDERGLLRTVQLLLPDDGSELVLVIDQFEEIFTLVEDETLRARFLEMLVATVTEKRSRVRIIVTLRADFYDRPLNYPEFGDVLRNQMETVLPLTAKGLERAIAEPAKHVGVLFEEGLVSTMVADMNYQAGALPLLQYALTELFEQRSGRILTHEAYQAIGGAVGALAKRAEAIYQELTPEAQAIARQMFLRLVTPGEGTEDTRRRATRAELAEIAVSPLPVNGEGPGVGLEVLEEVIDTCVSYRLLSLDNDPATRAPTVEVAHEAIIREWERLRGWVNESRSEILFQRQLGYAAGEWEAARRDDSYLLTGTRLAQAEERAKEATLALTPGEQAYLTASLARHDREVQAEAERQMRERQLEKRSRHFLCGLVAVLAVATLVSAGFSFFAIGERNAADNARNEAQQSAAEFRSIALTFGAQDALNHHQPDVALALAHEAVNMPEPPLQSELMFYNAATSTWIQHRYLVSDTRIWDALYHPDGKRIITTGWDGRAVIRDIDTERELQSLQIDGRLYDIAIHPDGQIIALGGDNGILRLWDIETNEVTELVAADTDSPQRAPLFNHDGTQLISTNAGTINIWNLETLEITRSFAAHDGNFIPAVHFSPDERLLISSGDDGLVKIWDVATGELLQTLDHREISYMYEEWAWEALFLDNGERVLTGAGYGTSLWNWRTKELIWSVEEASLTQDIALSPDNRTFVVGLNDGTARLRDLETGKLLHEYEGHSLRVQNVDYSPDGRTVLTGSNDGTAIIWPVNWEGTLRTALVHSYVIAWHPNRPLLAAVGVAAENTVDDTIRLVDTQTGEVVREFVGHREKVNSLAFSPDGRYLFSGDYAPSFDMNDQRVYVWDIKTGEPVMELGGQKGWINSIAFSPDGQLVAVGEAAGSHIILWDVATGERIKQLAGHKDWVNDVTFSLDGQSLYSGSRDGSLIQWDVQSGTMVREFAGHPGMINSLDLNSDGTRLVSASADQTAIVWDTVTGEIVMTLRGHTDTLWSADFSPDDSTLLTASSDGKMILWDAQTGARLWTYAATDTTYLTAAFSPDGQEIASAADDIITIWDASPPGVDLETWVTQNRYIPDFSCEQRALYRLEPLCAAEAPGS